MYRTEAHEELVIQTLVSCVASRMKFNEIKNWINEMQKECEEGELTTDEVWNAILCLMDSGFVAKASTTAEWFRITALGYKAYGDCI